ncbi:patatin-like phospholipase family protein [Halorientalis pallida]|uniref:Patatin-like phospholipase family protein n=1 Tax=Halorientalis pallida TaxID=2479928 RepID=A0A498L4F6_9EURY|nr:patatin-like phospholipase family protein [Halorientalis pallida]RXK51132.1 patatin-like phospholipase family protein [Halorientalis pallida]
MSESDTGASDTETPDTTNVAIACQGGGSHTAFTAGVLQHLLEEWDDDHRLVGISGTSGGAFNALVTWYGLVTGDESKSVALLDRIWADIAANEWSDRWTNEWVTALNRLESTGLPLPMVSPYQIPGADLGKRRIVEILERHVDFGSLPDLCTRTAPELVVGTVDVNDGCFETFTNEAVTPEAVLASAAVPLVFEGVEIDGHYHWDGLFSQNPPINDLMSGDGVQKPDELWVIQINPQEFEGVPATVEAIADRRNELSGNISLNQELHFVERVNDWIEAGYLPESEFSHTEIHRIEMGRRYGYATKVDRDPDFIAELMELGRGRAEEFLASR